MANVTREAFLFMARTSLLEFFVLSYKITTIPLLDQGPFFCAMRHFSLDTGDALRYIPGKMRNEFENPAGRQGGVS
jgi:hypothetical protein